jgi:ketosteroid isomerase-like protein
MTVTIDGKSMVAQKNVALVRSLFDLYNDHQSDPAWLDKCMALFAADVEVIDVPAGVTLYGPDGIKRLLLFVVESFPDMRAELTKVFATEDQAVLEGIWYWNDTAAVSLPAGALPSMRRQGELRFCHVSQIREGKIASVHVYYDMLTQMEQLGLVPAWR